MTKKEKLRVPPHSIEAEQAVLGGIMLRADAVDEVADKLRAEDFYRHDHRLIYAAIIACAEENKPLDVITISEQLEKTELLDEAGGMGYVAVLAKDAPGAANIRAYADIVRERAIFRDLIATGNDIAQAAFKPEGRDANEILDMAGSRILEAGERGNTKGPRIMRDGLTKFIEGVDTRFHNGGEVSGLSTGLALVDERTSGLQPGDLIIVAGRPSMGKTSLALGWAEHVSVRLKEPSLVFSMEMSDEQLIARSTSSLGRIPSDRIRSGQLSDEDWPRLTSAVTLLKDAPIYIDDSAALSPMQIRARARRIKRQHGLSLIVIDYLQLMTGGKGDRMDLQIGDMTRQLKALAKELQVPVILLSQLNRNLEQRPNKRPRMADLRESGAIEQDADVIIFVYRDEVYDENSADRGVAELIFGKHRNGEIGTVKTAFIGKFTRFENLDWGSYQATREERQQQSKQQGDVL